MEMEAELLQLAQEAVAALQLQASAGSSPSWVEIAQLLFSGVGLAWIGWGFFRMGQAGTRRDREIDVMAQGLRQQGEVMTEAVQGLRQQGQALERQGEAMTQALTQQGRALERQGEVLAELLRRTA